MRHKKYQLNLLEEGIIFCSVRIGMVCVQKRGPAEVGQIRKCKVTGRVGQGILIGVGVTTVFILLFSHLGVRIFGLIPLEASVLNIGLASSLSHWPVPILNQL